MEYPNYTGIPVRLGLAPCFWGFDHDIGVCLWIYNIPFASDIVCRVVDTYRFTTIQAALRDANCIPLLIGELAIGVAFIYKIK
jgi:hypothetical protein